MNVDRPIRAGEAPGGGLDEQRKTEQQANNRHHEKYISLCEQNYAEGVFFKLNQDWDVTKMKSNNKSYLDETESTACTNSSSTLESTAQTENATCSWNSTEAKSFERHHQPLLVFDPESKEPPEKDAAQALGKILQKSRNLPKPAFGFASNFVMVNQERVQRAMAPLKRLTELDEIARQHAQAMAAAGHRFHSDPATLRASFRRPARRMGENVAKGESIREIHHNMMKTASERNNILDRRYTHMGMATAKGVDGQLYLCQVFRG